MKNNVIEMENIKKIYSSGSVTFEALHDITLKITEKEFVAIIGASGSGKSTLLHLMGTLDKPTEGRMRLDGADTLKLSDSELARLRGRKIGFVFQFFNLYPTLTAKENVELPMVIFEKNPKEREEKALILLKAVGLEDRAGHLPSQLSGGQKQRVAIARALANDPKMILADEPTGNLDSVTGKEIMEMFMKLNKQGKTIAIVTHERSIASNAERTIQIKDGRVIKDAR